MISLALAAACIGLCFFAAIKDITTLTIPNWVNASIAGLGVVALAFSGLPVATIGWHFLIALIGLAICMGLFFGGVFGGGDAKMIPAVLIWAGPAGALPFILWTAIFGGLLAVLLLPIRSIAPGGYLAGRMFASLEEGAGAPYAVAIAAGLFFTMQQATLFAAIAG